MIVLSRSRTGICSGAFARIPDPKRPKLRRASRGEVGAAVLVDHLAGDELRSEEADQLAVIVLAVMVLSALIGMLNGALISMLGIRAIIETQAMSLVVTGANHGAGRLRGVGDVYLLNAVVTVFIEASTLKPGKLHILGTTIGVLLIGVINNGLSVMGVQTFWQYIVQGGILILALISASLNTVRRT